MVEGEEEEEEEGKVGLAEIPMMKNDKTGVLINIEL